MKAKITKKGAYDILDVMGPVVGILTAASGKEAACCVMHGTIPPGVPVPLHSHPDEESFYILDGELQVLRVEGSKLQWSVMQAGDFIHIPGNSRHAWHNTSG